MAVAWVDARPFVAKIDFLARDLAENQSVVALALGLTAKQMLMLVGPQPVQRLSAELARRILEATPRQLRHELRLYIPARQARWAARRLRIEGWSLAEAAEIARLDQISFARLLHGGDRFCPLAIELRLLAQVWLIQERIAA